MTTASSKGGIVAEATSVLSAIPTNVLSTAGSEVATTLDAIRATADQAFTVADQIVKGGRTATDAAADDLKAQLTTLFSHAETLLTNLRGLTTK